MSWQLVGVVQESVQGPGGGEGEGQHMVTMLECHALMCKYNWSGIQAVVHVMCLVWTVNWCVVSDQLCIVHNFWHCVSVYETTYFQYLQV